MGPSRSPPHWPRLETMRRMRGSHPLIVNNERTSLLSLSWRDYLLVSEAERELGSQDSMGLTLAEFYVRPLVTCSLGTVARFITMSFVWFAVSMVLASVPSLYTAKYLLGADDATPWVVISSHPFYITKVWAFGTLIILGAVVFVMLLYYGRKWQKKRA